MSRRAIWVGLVAGPSGCKPILVQSTKQRPQAHPRCHPRWLRHWSGLGHAQLLPQRDPPLGPLFKTVLGPASPWNRFWRDFLEVGSEANFLEVCFGRIPSGNFRTKATSKKSRPPSGNSRPNPPPLLPRSPSRSFSSHEAGWKIILLFFWDEINNGGEDAFL